MNVDGLFPTKYLKSADLRDRPWTVQIKHLKVEDVSGTNDPDERRPVLYFHNAQKGLVLNVTNKNTIAARYGKESDDWEGKAVELYPTETEFRGKMVPCIRVRIPVSTASKSASEPDEPEPLPPEAEYATQDEPLF